MWTPPCTFRATGITTYLQERRAQDQTAKQKSAHASAAMVPEGFQLGYRPAGRLEQARGIVHRGSAQHGLLPVTEVGRDSVRICRHRAWSRSSFPMILDGLATSKPAAS